MLSYGIMQGRLTPSKGRGIQFFPFDNWKEEFYNAKRLGLDEIEWIFDDDRHEDNPLWTIDGIKALKGVIDESGIKVRSVCFDYFMRKPFYKENLEQQDSVREKNLDVTKVVLEAMKDIGASLLEIPMVDNSSIKNKEEGKRAIEFLCDVIAIATTMNIKIGCETDMPVGTFRQFLENVNHNNIYANYDSGNSSGLGYNHEEEIMSLGSYIANVHIKDRKCQGTTMRLGTGSADFDKVFSSLKKIGYSNSIILQAARGEDGKEFDEISSQMMFVRDYCKKYDME